MAQTHNANVYYVPHSSPWPIVGAVAMFTTMLGVASWLNEFAWGKWVFFAGLAAMIFMLARWFADVINESVGGFYNKQVDTSFRMGMVWFIFSEVMFFAAFFGALFYARTYSVPWLGGAGMALPRTNIFGRGLMRRGRVTGRRISGVRSRPFRRGAFRC